MKNRVMVTGKKWICDIRFWIVILFLIRLIGITNPPLETGHNWRQSLTAMIARNFYEGKGDIFHPHIDMHGEQSGVIASEFPLFNYVIFIASEIFGYDHWYGRLINLIVSSFGCWFFFRLVEKYFGITIAFNSTIFLLVSIWFAFSRKIMPDTFSVSLVIAGLYYCSSYVKYGSIITWLSFVLLTSAGILCKIPSLYFLVLLLFPLFHNSVSMKRKTGIVAGASCIVIISCSWYFIWVPHLLADHAFQLYFVKNFREGFTEILPLVPQYLEKYYFSSLNSYLALPALIAGIILIIHSENRLFNTVLLLLTFCFGLFTIKTGAVFPLHNYYIIPFTPVMAFIAGFGITALKSKWQIIALCLIGVEAIANQQHDFFIKSSEAYKITLESVLDQNTNKNDLIVINGDQSPQLIYFAHRKGWIEFSSDLHNTNKLDSLAQKGARWLVVDKNKFHDPLPRYATKYQDENFILYSLSQ